MFKSWFIYKDEVEKRYVYVYRDKYWKGLFNGSL